MTTVNSYIPVNWENVSTFQQYITTANTSGAGYLFAVIDLLVFLVLLITMSAIYGWESAILSAGFIGIILTFLFNYMGVLSWQFASLFVGIIIIMIMYIMWSNRNN